MPVSYGENREAYKEWLLKYKPKTMLDVGMGYGELGKIAKSVLPDLELYGVEIFLPYLVHERSCAKIYRAIIVGDIRDIISKLWKVDVIVAFDVIEHLYRKEGIEIINSFRHLANMASLVAVPIVNYPQGEVHGNKNEIHLDQWTEEEMQAIGGNPIHLGKVVGTFEFKRGINNASNKW